jgi:hypothetical protein
MKKDIMMKKVNDVALIVAPRLDGQEEELWDSYLLNLKDEPITNVLVSSRGYGEIDGEKMRTTTLRHFFEDIPAKSLVQIEPIQRKLFGINNEYWISFTYNGYMFDKKYVFVADSISEENFTRIPVLNREGVMIR